MKIRKANKKDWREYLKLKKEEDKEYSIITNQKIRSTDEQIKKDFNKMINDKKGCLLVVSEDEKILGYLYGNFFSKDPKKFGYISDLFIAKKYRKKGLAGGLINNFLSILKKKRMKSVRLGVNIKNKNAINLYKKLGFKLIHYEMDKKIK